MPTLPNNINLFGSIENKKLEIGLDKRNFCNYVNYFAPKTFTIITHKKEYKCNWFGIVASNVIRDSLLKNHSLNEYVYDFDDECDEFQFICNFFNFDEILIDPDNMESLKEMCEALQIDCLLSHVNSYINEYDSLLKLIDEQQNSTDSVENLFDWLYNIKEKTVDSVKRLIVDSLWSKTKENVQELTAFLLQVIYNDIRLHHELADLIVELDKESDESNSLGTLKPFITQKLIDSFGSSNNNCSFVFNLNKRGFIPTDQIIKKIILCTIPNRNVNNNNNQPIRKSKLKVNFYVLSWFLHEIIQLKDYEYENIIKNDTQNILIRSYAINIDKYKEMIENGEPDDELTKALRHDDVDSLIKLVSTKQIDIVKALVPFNIFDNTYTMNYINYAAYYGSVKVFKYLLMNHVKLDLNSFNCAVNGRNTEIIKIVDQNQLNIEAKKKKSNDSFISAENPIFTAIKNHQNDLFDWFFENKLSVAAKNDLFIGDLISRSVINGNVHSLLEIFSHGYGSLIQRKNIQSAATNGFYSLTQIMFNLDNKKQYFPSSTSEHLTCAVSFGNLSICKIFCDFMDQNNFQECLSISLKYQYDDIINYFIDTLLNERFQITQKVANDVFYFSTGNTDKFNYFLEKVKLQNPKILQKFDWNFRILPKACTEKNLGTVKKILNEIKNKNLLDFTRSFIEAVKSNSFDICKYFFDNQLKISYSELYLKSSIICKSDVKIIALIHENAKESKNNFCHILLRPSILSKNKSVVKYILQYIMPEDSSLFVAVNTNDLEMVDLILEKRNDPPYINQVQKDGTVLLHAVKNNNLQIVERFLSIPGINPHFYNSNNETPLIIAAINQNENILFALIDYIGDYVQTHQYIIYQIIDICLKAMNASFMSFRSKDSNSNNNKIISILNRLIRIPNIDPNYSNGSVPLLIYAVNKKDMELVKDLLKLDKIDPNIYIASSGNTPLLTSISQCDIEFSEILIKDPRTNINQKNFQNSTPLTCALQKNQCKIADLIISDDRFDPNLNDMSYAFYLSDGELEKKIIQYANVDVNKILDSKESNSVKNVGTKLSQSIAANDHEMIDLIINHQSFDKIKSQYMDTLFKLISSGNVSIFKQLMNIISDEINTYKMNDKTLFEFALWKNNADAIKIIIQNPHLDLNKIDIRNQFVLAYTSIYIQMQLVASIDIMNIIYDFDQKHNCEIDFNKLLPNGKTYFTSIIGNLSNIKETVNFFLEHGADPNIPDKEGFYPFEYAIRSNSLQYALALIDSNKIDYNVKIATKKEYFVSKAKYKSYLHLAARSNNSIIKIFLERKLIDINITDDLGETPLMDACRNKQKLNIEDLFKMDDLDYLKCNNEGKNALQIISNNASQENIQNKEAFLKGILVNIDHNNEMGNSFKGENLFINNVPNSNLMKTIDMAKNVFSNDFKNNTNTGWGSSFTSTNEVTDANRSWSSSNNESSNSNPNDSNDSNKANLNNALFDFSGIEKIKLDDSFDLPNNPWGTFGQNNNNNNINESNNQKPKSEPDKSDSSTDPNEVEQSEVDKSISSTDPNEVEQSEIDKSISSTNPNENDSSETGKSISLDNSNKVEFKSLSPNMDISAFSFYSNEAEPKNNPFQFSFNISDQNKSQNPIISKQADLTFSNTSKSTVSQSVSHPKHQFETASFELFDKNTLEPNDSRHTKKYKKSRKTMKDDGQVTSNLQPQFFDPYMQMQWNQMFQIDDYRQAQFEFQMSQQVELLNSLNNQSHHKKKKKKVNK